MGAPSNCCQTLRSILLSFDGVRFSFGVRRVLATKICPTGGFNRTFQFLPWKSVVPFLCFSCVVLKVILWDANGVPKQKHNKMCIDCFFFSVGSNCAGGSGDPVETMAFIRPLIWMLLFGLGLGKDQEYPIWALSVFVLSFFLFISFSCLFFVFICAKKLSQEYCSESIFLFNTRIVPNLCLGVGDYCENIINFGVVILFYFAVLYFCSFCSSWVKSLIIYIVCLYL